MIKVRYLELAGGSPPLPPPLIAMWLDIEDEHDKNEEFLQVSGPLFSVGGVLGCEV